MSVKHTEHSVKNARLVKMGIEPPSNWDNLEEVRAVLKQEIGVACTSAIYAGVEVVGKRYSLTEHDQTELVAQFQAIKEGALAVPYHADGELCRIYSAAEFAPVANAAFAHVFYHRTYCNHLNAWVKRATMKQLNGISYGAELPKDLAESMATILAATGGVTA
jgi:hypothetical protein